MEEKILKTIQVYNDHANDYFRINASLEPLQDLLDFFITNVTGKRILDVGCGPGRDAKYFSLANFEVFGIDLSRNLLDLAQRNAPSATFRLMDMRKLDFPPGFFDGIWAAASVLHIPKKDALSTLRGFRIILKSEGLLYIGLYHEGTAYLPREYHPLVRALMRRYQVTKRIAFNRLLEGQSRQGIVEYIRRYELLVNARYIRSAIAEAQALIQSQQELVPLHYREAQWRAKEAHQRLTAYQHQLARQHKPLLPRQRQKLHGLERRAQKTASKECYWQAHWQHKTFPPVVFGGKHHLRAYQQGKLTKAEWQQRRNNGLYCVGEANQKGNANLRIHYDPKTDRFTFSLLVDGGKRGERIRVPLYVPLPFKETFKHHAKGTRPYTVRVQFSPDNKRLRVLVASDHPNPTVSNGQGIAGLDLNPAGIAVTLVYPDGNYRTSKWFAQPELLYVRTGKRAWRIGNLIKRVLAWIRSYGLNTLTVEDLRFSQRYGMCRQFNRLKSNFVYRQLLRALQSQALKKGFAVYEINPAYASLIGAVKYARPYGLNGHQAAALVIGRRGLGFSEKLHGHVNHSIVRLVVPPMEGWSGRQITALARDIDGLTARLGNSTAFKSGGSPPTTPGRRQGSGGGIVPRSHTRTPGKGALACSEEQPVCSTVT